MRPFCIKEVKRIGVFCHLAVTFGPRYSNQDVSAKWVAIFWAIFRYFFDVLRWAR